MDIHVSPNRGSQCGRRRHSRLRARLPATLVTLTENYRVVLLDLSYFGARVAVDEDVRPGAEAVLQWDQFEAFCKINWCHGGRCGLEFDGPLPGKVLIATRDLNDIGAGVDQCRVAARAFVNGG